jgi:hypothetical protein
MANIVVAIWCNLNPRNLMAKYLLPVIGIMTIVGMVNIFTKQQLSC